MFHDVQEIWGSGQQQVRNVWNIAVWQFNLWMHTLIELWAWRKPADQLVRLLRIAIQAAQDRGVQLKKPGF